ncbi:potassium/proton antiporter [Chloroflexia bacterium SDU3-3]|nr:potassium/proton antiporter [Chloroflexia bacterium SDU3-3]
MFTIEEQLFIGALLLLASVIASKASSRFGIPSLLLFLAIGMFIGADGPGNIYFDNAQFAQNIGTVALAFILFSGGLDTDWKAIRPVLRQGLLLANVGVLVSTGIFGIFAKYVLGLGWGEGLLLGSIISSTDAAAVFSVLRTTGVHLKGQLEPLIELESGSNDPIAVFLTVGLTELLIHPGASIAGLVPLFFWEMALGALVGFGIGWAMTWAMNRIHLDVDGLYPVLSIATVMLVFGASSLLHGNGFLAVYLAGITMGNRRMVRRQSIVRFHDAIAWLMQIAMFLTLGLQVFPSQVIPLAGQGLLGAAVLIFVARPASVFVALAFSGMSVREKLMISWTGLRGAVPIVLATFPLLDGVAHASFIFNIVFFIVLASVLVQGTTIARVARWLGLNRREPGEERHSLAFVPSVGPESRVLDLVVPIGALVGGRTIRDLELPHNVLVILIERNGEQIVPSGATVIRAGDHLRVLADPGQVSELNTRLLDLQSKQSKPAASES